MHQLECLYDQQWIVLIIFSMWGKVQIW
jgi:hypothetical protein